MKKSLFFVAAASALMLTACSSENDPLQSVTQSLQTTLQDNAVGFDVYTPAATEVTRAGQGGTMTTGRLQRTPTKGGGFGVYAYLVEDENDDAGATDYVTWQNRTNPTKAPNFMVNQLVEWNNTNLGWVYDPLKYWPNETDNDSQNTKAEMEAIGGTKHLDRLTFFAYAPYVAAGDKTVPGIMHVTDKDGKITALTSKVIEPTIGYKASLDDPSKSVDLLWGVAPAGGLSYTAVNGETKTVLEGNPLIDMVKPDVNTSMKFLFQHALARIGINVVAAIDQVGAGGTLDPKTKITVNEVTLTGMFGETGYLNLDNPTANVANWVRINSTQVNGETTAIGTPTTLTLSVDKIAPDLRFNGTHDTPEAQTATGVTTAKKDLINGRYFTLDAIPAYTPARLYYDENAAEKHATYTVTSDDGYYTLASNNYTQKTGSISSPNYPTITSGYYTIAEDATFAGNHVKKAAVLYTAEEIAEHNAPLDIWNASTIKTPAQDAVLYANVDEYNADHDPDITADEFALLTDDQKIKTPAQDAVYYSAEEITAHNATLDIWEDGKIKTAAEYGYPTEGEGALAPTTELYTKTGTEGTYVYTHAGAASTIEWGVGNTNTYYTITPTALAATDIDFKYTGDVYDVERNYFMVVPTNNVNTLNGGLTDAQKEALRKVRVKIEYYITTEDSKLGAGRAQTKNVIEKDVVFPSLANGKSYMLNLVLGLTSVKMEAEVDDWKVINVQGDLPQNTAE